MIPSLAVPASLIFASLVYIILSFATRPVLVMPQPYKFIGNFALVVIIWFIILSIQRLQEYTLSYAILSFGLILVFMGELENTFDNILVITNFFGIVRFELFEPFGFFIVGLGLLSSIRLLISTQEIAEIRQKESELYATLLRHDLRNDLQILLGYIEIALENQSLQNSEGLDTLESARAAGMRMAQLVKTFAIRGGHEKAKLVEIITRTAIEAKNTHEGNSIIVNYPSEVKNYRVSGGTHMLQ